MDALADENATRTTYTDDAGVLHVYTRQSRTTTKIDEKGLRKALTAKVFDRYTTPKLDRKKLEDAVEQQEVDPLVVAKYLEQKSSEEFLVHRKEEDG